MKSLGKGPKSKDLLHKRAQAYYAWGETLKLNETDSECRKNFFPDCAEHGGIWSDEKFL